MKTLFRILAFILIWGFTFGATYLVWNKFGAIIGILFFLFGAGLAGAIGMLIATAIAKLFGIKADD